MFSAALDWKRSTQCLGPLASYLVHKYIVMHALNNIPTFHFSLVPLELRVQLMGDENPTFWERHRLDTMPVIGLWGSQLYRLGSKNSGNRHSGKRELPISKYSQTEKQTFSRLTLKTEKNIIITSRLVFVSIFTATRRNRSYLSKSDFHGNFNGFLAWCSIWMIPFQQY